MKIDVYHGNLGGPLEYDSEYEVGCVPRVGEHLVFENADNPEHLYEV